jgi:Holliday junction resolvase RusA-like endonuclease
MADSAHITVPGRLLGLNEYTAACRSNARVGAAAKAKAQEAVEWCIRAARPPHISGKAHIAIDYYEPDARRDPDNISATGRKVILDALAAQHVIRGDSQRCLAMPQPFTERFFVDKTDPRIEVTVTDCGTIGVDGQGRRR